MQELMPYLPIVLVAFLMFRRTRQSRTFYPKWLWVLPTIFMLLMAGFVYGAMQSHAHFSSVDLAIIAAATAAGAALGVVRAQTLALSRHADTGAIEAKLSMWGLAFLLSWLVLRVVFKQMGFSRASEPFGVFNTAMFALVCSSFVARAIILHRRCAALPSAPPKPTSGELAS